FEGECGDRLLLAERREHHLSAGPLGLRVVLSLAVRAEKSPEGDDSTAGRELGLGPPDVWRPVGHRGDQADLGAGAGGVVHLTGHGALPDQLVEAQLVTAQRPRGLLWCAERLPG